MLSRRQFLSCCAGSVSVFVQARDGLVSAEEAKVRLAIVVAADSPLDALAMRDLKRMYRGDPVAGPKGTPLITFAPPGSSRDRIAFERAVLGMSPEDAARHWIDRKIRGQGGPPKAVDSSDVLQQLVRAIDGAIGYVRASDVRPGVKVLRVDGYSLGDNGYPLSY